MEVTFAGTALGTETPVSTLTDTRLGAFCGSDSVTRKRNGKPKSPLSVRETCRVLRQAFVWTGHADLVPTEVDPWGTHAAPTRTAPRS